MTKRQRSGPGKAARIRGSETEGPEWLSARIDKELIKGELSEPRSIAEVAEHFSTIPGKPLPGDLLPVLVNWLVERHGLKITQGRRGAPPTPLRKWYPLIDRLVGLGLPITDACLKVADRAGLKDNLHNLTRQYRRDRDIEAKLSNDLAEAWLDGDETAFAKAMTALSRRTEKGE